MTDSEMIWYNKKRISGENNGASKHKKDYNIRFEKRNKS